jgi:hypothetical protein
MKSEKIDHPEIPKGDYCYTTVKTENGLAVRKPCPYHGIDRNHGARKNGFCQFTGKTDWGEDDFFNLLWDWIKSCGINREF